MGVYSSFFLGFFLSQLGGWIFGEIDELLNNGAEKLAGIAGDDNGDDGMGGFGFFKYPRIKRKDSDDDDDNDDGGDDPPFPPCPAYAVVMRSGGVEFHLPRQINNFTNFFSFNKCHYVAFEYEDLNIEEIIDLVNSKFLINDINVKSLSQIYDTIFKEIAYGFLCKNELPSISLNFNKDGLLYSIMDNYYKNTLTGNILTFLDYYLKSYANGGFFKEEFIYEWQNKQNQDFDYLSENLTDFKKYIHDLKNEPDAINYCSIYDMVNIGITEAYDNNYISAFRIIGNLDSNLSYFKNIFFPNCFYHTQYDFDIMSKWKKEINEEIIEKINKKPGKNKKNKIKKEKGVEENLAIFLEKIHKVMANRVTILMNKIPFLKPYFELLKMITFAIHYLPNVHRAGLFPLFNQSIQNEHINIKYCKSIPKVFPPLPIRKTINLKLEIFPSELINCFKNNNFEELNKFISICYYESENVKMNEVIEKQIFLLEETKNYIRNEIHNKLPPEDKSQFLYLTEENMKIPDTLKQFQNVLFSIPILIIKDDLDNMLNILNKENNENIKPKKSREEIYNIKNFSELKEEITEIMNLFQILINQYEYEINSFSINIDDKYITSKYENEINQNAIKTLKKRYRNKRNDEIEIMVLTNDANAKPIIDKIKKDFFDKETSEISKKKNDLLNILKNLKNHYDNMDKSLKDLETKLIEYTLIDNNLLKKYLSYFQIKLTEINVRYTKPSF